MTAECDELAATIAELRADIDVEQRRCNAIEARINQAEEDAKNDDSEQRLKEQKEAIKYVFELCYDPDDTLEAIEMLTRIEKKLEQTFAKLDQMTDEKPRSSTSWTQDVSDDWVQVHVKIQTRDTSVKVTMHNKRRTRTVYARRKERQGATKSTSEHSQQTASRQGRQRREP